MSWLLPPYDDAALSLAFQAAWGRGAIASLVVDEAISPAAARRLRGLARAKLEQYSLADRGRFRFAAARSLPVLDEVAAELAVFAAAATGLALDAGAATLTRLAHGDYALRWDDWRRRPQGPLLEATLDLSPAPCPAADTVYSESPVVHFSLPQAPGQLGLVRRSPTGSRFDRYLSCHVGRSAVWKLRVAFAIG